MTSSNVLFYSEPKDIQFIVRGVHLDFFFFFLNYSNQLINDQYTRQLIQ